MLLWGVLLLDGAGGVHGCVLHRVCLGSAPLVPEREAGGLRGTKEITAMHAGGSDSGGIISLVPLTWREEGSTIGLRQSGRHSEPAPAGREPPQGVVWGGGGQKHEESRDLTR